MERDWTLAVLVDDVDWCLVVLSHGGVRESVASLWRVCSESLCLFCGLMNKEESNFLGRKEIY